MGNILGKSLVILNLLFSIGLGVLGFAIYANRINWGAGKAGGPSTAQGLYQVKKKEYDELTASIAKVYVKWEESKNELLALEAKAPKNRQWYQERIKDARSGAGDVLSIKYLEGKVAEGPEGLPALEDQYKTSHVGSLHSLQRVEQGREQTEANISKAQKEIENLIQRQKDLTLELNGEPDRFLGMRTLLEEQLRTERNALAQTDHLRPLRVNRQAEADLLIKRNRALEERVAELEK